jgi:hypothetical protein
MLQGTLCGKTGDYHPVVISLWPVIFVNPLLIPPLNFVGMMGQLSLTTGAIFRLIQFLNFHTLK